MDKLIAQEKDPGVRCSRGHGGQGREAICTTGTQKRKQMTSVCIVPGNLVLQGNKEDC
jgi:hypothetical protein